MEKLINVFKALSDPNRVSILKLLELRQFCVCEIPVFLGLANSTVSKHLSILRDAGLISDKKSGKWVYYNLNTNSKDHRIRQILSLLPMWLNDDESVIELIEKVKSPPDDLIHCEI